MPRLIIALLACLSACGLWGSASSATPLRNRWTASSPDATIALARRAVRRGGADALARLVLIHHLNEVATAGQAAAALGAIARGHGALAQTARWLRLTLAPPRHRPWAGRNALPRDEADGTAGPTGLLRSFAVLGPFRDSGGGLQRREGPERPDHDFTTADYSWGAYRVRTVRSVVTTVDARGLPLDLYVSPRKESCSYLSTAVHITRPAPLRLWVAASGSLRVSWDGRTIGSDEAVHARALLDRLQLVLRTTPGWHLLTLKDCSGALPDSGRVRVRLSDEAGRDETVTTTSALARLQAIATAVRANRPATTAERVPTPLERTLEVSQTAAVDRVLATAIVRALGGADDLRARKTPGLLDRVARSRHLSADALAMVGYVGRQGANRSGWLNRALERARRGGDTPSAAWAQRALVEAHLHAGQRDLGYATSREPVLRDQPDAHARWLRAHALAELGGVGLRDRALHQLIAITGDEGKRTPAVVWRAIARLSGAQQPRQRLAALEALAALSIGATGPAYVGAHTLAGPQALEQVARQVLLQQSGGAAVSRIAKLLLSAGRYRASQDVFWLASTLSPNLASAQLGLARTTALLRPAGGGHADVVAALERAAELRPSDAALAAEVAFYQGQTSDRPQLGDDAAYLVAPSVFLERARTTPMPETGVFARQLHWRRVVRLHEDGRVSQLIHYAREIGIEPRTEPERYERLPVRRHSELLIARVHHRDGSVLPPEERDDNAPMVRWPKLHRGDVVEVAVREWTAGPIGRRGDPPYYFVDYVGALDTHPVLYNEVDIDAPIDKPLYFEVIGGKPDERHQHTRAGRRITELVWRHPPSVADEPLSPPSSELLPVVVGSPYRNWDAFLQWYEGAVEGFTNPDDQIRRLATELTAKARTRNDKVRALFEFVADDIRYVNYVSGEWWLPNRPQQLLARRQGDCDDKAMLLISLLGAVGIEGREVLVQTRHTRRRAVMRAARAAVPMFDHGIVYLPGQDGEPGRYLDATSPQSRLGTLPAMDSGAMALRIDGPRGNHVVETPAANAADHGVEARWTLKLDPQGGGTLQADERHLGDAAFRLRTHLGQADARAQWVEQALIGGWLSSVTVAPEVRFDGELGSGAARVRYHAHSGSLARREGHDLVLTLAPPVPITATLAPLPKRTLPVELPAAVAPSHRTLSVDVVAPRGYRFETLPPDGEAKGGSFGRAKLTLKSSADGRRLHLQRSVYLQSYRITVDEYPAWRRWLQQIDRLMQRSVRMVPRAAAGR